MSKPKAQPASTPPAPTDELLARFQLENERAIERLRAELLRLHEGLASKVAALGDQCDRMTAAVTDQSRQLEDAVHHTREGVKECNLALMEAAKAAREAADSAAVFEKLKETQPDFHRAVRDLEVRVAKVVDTNAHLGEQLVTLSKRLDEFELVADSVEETQGTVRGIDIAVQKLDQLARTSRPI